MKVLLDPGHGVNTLGKRSPDGKFLEYLWNRKIASIVLKILTTRGYDADIIVPEMSDISLKTRVSRVNQICQKHGINNVILVSIHSNAAGSGVEWMTAQGWSCYTTKGETKSDTLSECLYDVFERAFPERKIRKDYQDGDRDWEANFYLIQKTCCPAVLIENFFYDNLEECKWLLQEDVMARIATATADGIINYINKVRV